MSTLSVVLVSSHARPLLAAALERLRPQCVAVGAELIVVRTGLDGNDENSLHDLERVVLAGAGATLPQLRALGLAAASGEWVLLTEDNCVTRTDWVQQLVAAMNDAVDVVGGVITNRPSAGAIDAGAGFAEYGFYGPGQPAEGPPALACANIAYRRRIVADVAAWSRAGQWESELHGTLARRGARFRLVPTAVVESHLPHRVGAFCRNRFDHGRHFAAVRRVKLATLSRVSMALATPLLPALLTWRVWVRAGRASPGAFLRSLPFVATFLTAWSAGEAVGYLRGSPRG